MRLTMRHRIRGVPLLAATILALLCTSGWTSTQRASCKLASVDSARRQAKLLFDTAAVEDAVAKLRPFRDLGCLSPPAIDDAAAKTIGGFAVDGQADNRSDVYGALPASRRPAAVAYAWLLNDMALYQSDHRYHQTNQDDYACYPTLAVLFDKNIRPVAWLTPALRRASIANLLACNKACFKLECTIPNASVLGVYGRHDKSFSSHPCPFGKGEQIDETTCVEIAPRVAKADLDLAGIDKPDAELRTYCPTLQRFKRGPDGKPISAGELTLSNDSKLYDVSDCCVDFGLTGDPASHRIKLTGAGRDCFGGTAEFGIEEIYAIDPQGTAKLLQNNNEGYH